jgi:Uncharacterized protein conserved in bacteria
MKITTKYFGELEVREDKAYSFPEGIPGFENEKNFIIIENEDENSPFQWLQSTRNPDLAFVTIDPFKVITDYEVEIPEDEVESLKIQDIADVLLLAIVVVPEDFSKISANLLAPIIMNAKNHTAKQVTMNTNKYKVRQYIIDELRKRGGQD